MDTGVLRQDRAAEEHAVQRVVARPERPRLYLRALTGGHPDADEPPSVGEHADAVDEALAADRVENDLHTPRVGQLVGALDEVFVRVVDRMVQPERLQPLQLLLAGGRRDHGRAGALDELDRDHADTARPSVDQNGLARGEVAGGEQALVRSPERLMLKLESRTVAHERA